MLFLFLSVFRCVIVPKGFKAAGMLLELNRKIKIKKKKETEKGGDLSAASWRGTRSRACVCCVDGGLQ